MLIYAVIHCEWDEWAIGECSETCGTGTRTNTRLKLVEENDFGTCTGQPTEHEECKLQECPGKYVPLFYVEMNILYINILLQCVYLMSNNITIKTYKIVHCEWDEWKIGECSLTCGGGERTNTREEKQSAEHGGDECEGLSSITESCNIEECPGTKLIKSLLLCAIIKFNG